MRTSVIIKSTQKFFSATCVLFMVGFTGGKVNYVLVDVDSNRCILVTCLQISHLDLLQGPQKHSSVGTLALTRMSFKLFSFLKPVIEMFSKPLLCSLWIFDKSFPKNRTISNIKIGQ